MDYKQYLIIAAIALAVIVAYNLAKSKVSALP